MKDATHRLKRVQKKILRSARQSSGGAKPFSKENINHTPQTEENISMIRLEKRADTNHRVPRLRNNRSMIH